MSGRWGELSERIDAVDKLGAVVNVMRGTAGARVDQARQGLDAVEAHAAVVSAAIRDVLTLLPPAREAARDDGKLPTARVVFGAEQGFVGGFNDAILDAMARTAAEAAGESGGGPLLLIGRRAGTLAAERGIVPTWQAAMPLHIQGIPGLADQVVDVLFRLVADRGVRRFEAVWGRGGPDEGGYGVERTLLFPLDPGSFGGPAGPRPLVYQPPRALLQDLTEEHVHAQLCRAALHAFAAENEARMAVMSAAGRQVEHRMDELKALRRRLRQEEITAEIIELSAGFLNAGEELAVEDGR